MRSFFYFFRKALSTYLSCTCTVSPFYKELTTIDVISTIHVNELGRKIQKFEDKFSEKVNLDIRDELKFIGKTIFSSGRPILCPGDCITFARVKIRILWLVFAIRRVHHQNHIATAKHHSPLASRFKCYQIISNYFYEFPTQKVFKEHGKLNKYSSLAK